MPCRKRDKGRARKAKAKDAAKIELCSWRHWPHGKCRHGLPPTPPEDHVCYSFKRKFHYVWRENIAHLGVAHAAIHACVVSYDEFPQVWNDSEHREIIRSYLIWDGVVSLLNGDANPSDHICVASGLVGAIALPEHYDPAKDFDMINLATTDKEWMRKKDVIGGCKRCVVKFFNK